MYPPRFDYVAPTTVDEVLAVLAERGDEAKVLAGGQSLIPMMKLRFAFPELLVDVNRVPGLDAIDDADGHLRVGALVDPLGDWASVMLACSADVVARSQSGERVIPMTDFITGPFTTALEPTELVTEVRVPKYAGRGGGTYVKLERKVGDYATVGVATHLDLDGGGSITTAGVALTSVAPNNIKAVEAEQALVGEAPTEALFAEAAELAARAAEPKDDVRGSAEYKRNVVRVFTRRGLATALEHAQG